MTPFIPTFPNINPLERLRANPGIFQYQLYFHKEVSCETVNINMGAQDLTLGTCKP